MWPLALAPCSAVLSSTSLRFDIKALNSGFPTKVENETEAFEARIVRRPDRDGWARIHGRHKLKFLLQRFQHSHIVSDRNALACSNQDYDRLCHDTASRFARRLSLSIDEGDDSPLSVFFDRQE